MQFFPNVKTFLSIGPVAITWYAIFIISGAIIAYKCVEKKFMQMGYNKELLEDFAFYLFPIALIGARLWYVIFEWRQYINDPIRIIYIHEGGLAIHGGLFAGLLFGIYFFKKRNINVLRIADTIFPFVMIAQAIGRWGNFMNQEAYGRVVSEAYYRYFPSFIKNMMYIDGAYREPTFLYESIGNLIGFVLIYYFLRKFGRRKYGDLLFGYLMYYGVIRFFIEGLRTDSLMILGLRTAQLISIGFVIVGMIGYLLKDKTKPIIGFDLDGTLLNSEPLIIESFKYTFHQLDPNLVISEEEYHSFLGFPLEETFKKYAGDDYQHYVAIYREHNEKNHDATVKLYDNAQKILQQLKENGYDIAIISSKKLALVQRAIDLFSLNEWVDVVIGNESTQLHKPNAEPLQVACEQLGRSHDYFVYVGDSVQDIKACKNIGGFSVAVLFDSIRTKSIIKEQPDKTIHNLEEIITILKEERVWQNSSI